MADIVRFGADASDYFNVVDRMRGSLKGLGGDVRNTSSIAAGGFAGGDGGGLMGFLKGERAVKGQAKFLVAGLLEARDASTAAESALSAFIYSTHVGFGTAVIAAGVFTAWKLLTDHIEKTTAAKIAFDEAMTIGAAGLAGLGPAELGAQFDKANAALTTFRELSLSTKSVLVDLATTKDVSGGVAGIITRGETERSQEAMGMQRDLNVLANQRADAEIKIATAKARVVSEGSEEAELALITLEHQQKRLAISREGSRTGDQGTQGRIKADTITEGAEKQKITDKHADEEKKRLKESADFEMKNLDDYYDKKGQYEKKFEAALKARAQEIAKDAANEAQAKRDILNLKKSPTDPTGLLGDVGKIAQDPEAYKKRLMEQIKTEQAGQALIDQAKAEQARQQAGFAPSIDQATSDMYNRILDATKAQEKATSLEELSKMDFSAIAKLGDPSLDFSGIEALAGLSIVVQ